MAKKRIRHEIRLIIILAVLSAVFFGLFFGIRALESHKTDMDKELVSMAALEEMPSSIEVVNDTEPFVLERQKSSWIFKGDPELPISDLQVTEARSDLKYFEPGRIIRDAEDSLEAFGLKDPTARITASTDSGKITYNIGRYNPVTGEYYVTVDGLDAVFMVAKQDAESMMMPLLDYVKAPSVSEAEFSVITGIRAEKKGEVLNIDVTGGRYMADDGISNTEVNSQKVMTLFNCFTSNKFKCVSRDAGEAELEEYGLDSPEITVFFKEGDNGEEYDMYVGEGKDGAHYICQNSKKIVYLFDEDKYISMTELLKTANLM